LPLDHLAPSLEQYRYLHKLESIIRYSTLFIEDEKKSELHIRSFYIGEYDEKRFGDFFEIFIKEINYVMNDEMFKKLFIIE
jgi:hypothetical protein